MDTLTINNDQSHEKYKEKKNNRLVVLLFSHPIRKSYKIIPIFGSIMDWKNIRGGIGFECVFQKILVEFSVVFVSFVQVDINVVIIIGTCMFFSCCFKLISNLTKFGSV